MDTTLLHKIISEMERDCPLLFDCLNCALSDKGKMESRAFTLATIYGMNNQNDINIISFYKTQHISMSYYNMVKQTIYDLIRRLIIKKILMYGLFKICQILNFI